MSFDFIGEVVSCNLCGSTDHELIADKGRDGGVLYTVICRDCGLVFTNPMPTKEELDRFYRVAYRVAYKGTYTPKLKHVYRSGIRSIPRYLRLKQLGYTGGNLLDIGSGGGNFCI